MKIFRLSLFLLSFVIMGSTNFSALGSNPGLVPLPVKQTLTTGEFLLTGNTEVRACRENEDLLDYYLMREGAVRKYLPEDESTRKSVIRILTDSEIELPSEGYRLAIMQDSIIITAGDRSGAIYGIETLMQLMEPQKRIAGNGREPIAIACQIIEDYPRFTYRAMHLDIARTFSDKKTVLRYIDNMARHKLNKFHWHLTDDEGWRIEIKSYPKLTQIGAFRGGDSPVKHVYGAWDKKYGGFFTQDDIREVVEYAAFRGIEIIPEIDLPGHSRAAAKVHPEILCGGKVDTSASGDDRRNVWCASKESNYEMLDKILGEIAGLFPSAYIHVGGDEVDEAPWTNCPECGPKVKAASAHRLNGQFMTRLNEILRKHGKKQAVWNEAMNGGNLPKESLVYGWENVEVCRKALQAGYKTVIMPAQYFYFDMRQAPGEAGMTWGGTVPLKKVYSFEPSTVGITAAEQKNIIGIEGAFWAEIPLSQKPGFLDYQTYPRICALAEVAWSPGKSRNWDGFYQRMVDWHFSRLVSYGIKFRIDPPTAAQMGGRIVVTPPFKGAQIRYTTDGSEPNRNSLLSGDTLENIDKNAVYRFKAFFGTAQSQPAYLDGRKEVIITTEYELTSSMKQSSTHPFSFASDKNPKTSARTRATCNRNDWFEWTFSKPLDAGSITIKTGANYMGRCVVPSGYIEASYDGMTYEMIEPKFSVTGTFEPKPGLRSLRLTVMSEDNGEEFVIIHDLSVTSK